MSGLPDEAHDALNAVVEEVERKAYDQGFAQGQALVLSELEGVELREENPNDRMVLETALAEVRRRINAP